MSAIVVLTTAPDLKTAHKIARVLVEKRLAACVNVFSGVKSFYRWKGRLEKSAESLLMIKTLKKNFPTIEKILQTVHPYELPELIALAVERGSRSYLSWIKKSA